MVTLAEILRARPTKTPKTGRRKGKERQPRKLTAPLDEPTKFADLPPRHQAFVVVFVDTLDYIRAAVTAGFEQKRADQEGLKLLSSRTILHAIREYKQERDSLIPIPDENLTPQYVLKRLKEEADYKGDNASHSARVKALDSLAKLLGMVTSTNVHHHIGAMAHIHAQQAQELDVNNMPTELARELLEYMREAESGKAPGQLESKGEVIDLPALPNAAEASVVPLEGNPSVE